METTPEMDRALDQIRSGDPEQMLQGFMVWVPWATKHAQGHYHEFAKTMHAAGLRLYNQACFDPKLADEADNLYWQLASLQQALNGIGF